MSETMSKTKTLDLVARQLRRVNENMAEAMNHIGHGLEPYLEPKNVGVNGVRNASNLLERALSELADTCKKTAALETVLMGKLTARREAAREKEEKEEVGV